ncbi:MAG: hypothetical protein ABIQ32_09085 [Sphingomicrobium sp.]
MYAFPSASELDFLIGREMETVCIGSWVLNFGFGQVSLDVEGAIEHVDQDGTVRKHNTDEARRSPICLHHLLGQKVRTVDVEPFCLTLTFTRGDTLRVFSNEGPYECGQIYDEQGKVTVF